MAKEKKSIIIRKIVKKGHGGHHGGSWKVAYADFVTAMMAFFMVMWILGMDESTRSAIEAYFANPVGLEKGYSSGTSPLSSGNSPSAVKITPIKLMTRDFEMRQFQQIGDRIQAQLDGPDGLRSISAQVEILITEQGLRIELLEGEGETFFEFGSAAVKPTTVQVLGVIAHELMDATAPVVVEGHTDSAPFGSSGYSNWELSADRANAARREMERAGLGKQRVGEIRGHADRHLRNPANPLDAANRRITILLPFTSPPEVDLPGTEGQPL